MRQKRAKAYKKLMAMYELSFGFRQPYQVLVDAGMCSAAVDHKIEFVKQLATVLQGNAKPMITQCCIVELYKAGEERQPVVDLAKTFERRKCNHREAIEGDECVKTVVGDKNKHRYIIATQSQPLRNHLRTIPAVPIAHIKKSVMILEPPSGTTLNIKAEAEESALHPTAPERGMLPVAPSKPDVPIRRKKKAKGPNPLSVKKKKPKLPPLPGKSQGEAKAGVKRKREDGGEDESEGKKPKRRNFEDGEGSAGVVES